MKNTPWHQGKRCSISRVPDLIQDTELIYEGITLVRVQKQYGIQHENGFGLERSRTIRESF